MTVRERATSTALRPRSASLSRRSGSPTRRATSPAAVRPVRGDVRRRHSGPVRHTVRLHRPDPTRVRAAAVRHADCDRPARRPRRGDARPGAGRHPGDQPGESPRPGDRRRLVCDRPGGRVRDCRCRPRPRERRPPAGRARRPVRRRLRGRRDRDGAEAPLSPNCANRGSTSSTPGSPRSRCSSPADGAPRPVSSLRSPVSRCSLSLRTSAGHG